jgi:MFS transporter, ACS family, D-galactonate transporter
MPHVAFGKSGDRYVCGIPVRTAMSLLGVAMPSAIYVIGNAIVGEIAPAAQHGALLAIRAAVTSTAGLVAHYVMGSDVESAACGGST